MLYDPERNWPTNGDNQIVVSARVAYLDRLSPLTVPEPIPYPPRLPFLKNLFSIDLKRPVMSIAELSKQYHPIMELAYPNGESVIFVTGYELCRELCDEKRFQKNINFVLTALKQVIGNGLFTAETQSDDWGMAHRVLLPGFSQKGMREFHPYMQEAAGELVQKWDNLPDGRYINLTDDMTRLTFETIGLAGFGYRLESFRREEPHPFVAAMLFSLRHIMQTFALPDFAKKLMYKKQARFEKEVAYMFDYVDGIIRERRARPEHYADRYDFLSLMLQTTDPETGRRLDDENIRYQIITFLTAGHETTAGLLGFTFYHLLTHPEALARAYAEVDELLGPPGASLPDYQQVNKLKYLKQLLNETLRLNPTAPSFGVTPLEDTLLGGKYAVAAGQDIQVMLPALHREETQWGAEAESFCPAHFHRDASRNRDAYAYKPFGNGQRACIGRHFALHEATLALAVVLQRYELHLKPGYEFTIEETLTLRPHDLQVRVTRRATAPTPTA